jgi:molybdopterin-containing oxidoreductase family membrane subunit
MEKQPLPYGIGRFGMKWWAIAAVLLGVIAAGAYAYSRQVTEGEIVTGLRDVGTRGGAPWGLYIAFEMWAVGIGFGAMMLLGVIEIGRLSHMRPVARALGIAGMATLFVGGWSIIADVGQPVRAIVNIIRYARPMSPFFGTFTIGLVAAFATMLVYLFLDGRPDAARLAPSAGRWRPLLRLLAAGYSDSGPERQRRRQTATVLGVGLLVVGVVAASTSGFVFGIQQGRPGWVSAVQAPASVTFALATGAASAIVLAVVLKAALNEQQRFDQRLFSWLSNIMTAVALVAAYFVLVEVITAGYEARREATPVWDAVFTGRYAPLFWLSNAFLIVGLLIGGTQLIRLTWSPGWTALAAVAVLAAALIKRYLLVVPPLTEGRLLHYSAGSYSPTWVEYLVVLGLVALGIGFFMFVMKIFPVVHLTSDREAAK